MVGSETFDRVRSQVMVLRVFSKISGDFERERVLVVSRLKMMIHCCVFSPFSLFLVGLFGMMKKETFLTNYFEHSLLCFLSPTSPLRSCLVKSLHNRFPVWSGLVRYSCLFTSLCYLNNLFMLIFGFMFNVYDEYSI